MASPGFAASQKSEFGIRVFPRETSNFAFRANGVRSAVPKIKKVRTLASPTPGVEWVSLLNGRKAQKENGESTKGSGKPHNDPASYRGIYLTCMTTKLFEGILNERLSSFTTTHDTLTPYQFGSKKGHQAHDAIYSLTATIRDNQQIDKAPTYCAFIDFSTAYPAVHRNRLTNILHRSHIRGKLWRLLTSTYHLVQVRILHPLLGPDRFTPILRGLPEGSRLSPPLFGIFIAELLHLLEAQFPNATTYTSSGPTWLGALAYVDDLVLISQSPVELQAMIDTCQSWCEKSRIEINVDKTKVMTFNPHLAPDHWRSYNSWSINSSFLPPDHIHKTRYLQTVDYFKYLGIPLDQSLTMQPPCD